jgi:sugar phosphate isomerase/epimerase
MEENMKISVSSYSFQRLIGRGSENQLSVIKLASELGFDGIEFITLSPHDGSTQHDYAEKIKEEAAKFNLPITSYAVGANIMKENYAEEISNVKKQVDIAAVLGVKVMRHDAYSPGRNVPAFAAVLPVVADACREIAEYAAEKGVVTTVENHGMFFQDSTRMEQLYAAVNHPNFGLLVDIGNFLCVDDDPIHATSLLAPYCKLAHAKDFHVKPGSEPNPGGGFFKSRGGNYLRGAIIGHGNVPVKQCVDILKAAGYSGPLVIEFEGMEDNVQALKVGLANLRGYVG